MFNIRKNNQVNVVFHYPKTKSSQESIEKCIADLHSDFVIHYIQNLNCTQNQKNKLLDLIILNAKKSSG